MLKRLGDGLSTWKPPVKSLTPLDAIRSAWPQIVGGEVAKHCMPSEMSGETLTVLTRSGTWSQQLGFLEADIVARLAQLDASIRVTALRFRVGKIAAATARRVMKPQRIQQTMRLETPAMPTVTLDELIARMKMRSMELRRARGPRCARCGLLLDQGRLCAPCKSLTRQETKNGMIRMLIEVPWLSDDELRGALGPIASDDIAAARRTLLDRWKRDLDRLERKKTFSRGEPERATAVAYVLLETGLTPDRLTRVITRYTLGPRLDALLYGE